MYIDKKRGWGGVLLSAVLILSMTGCCKQVKVTDCCDDCTVKVKTTPKPAVPDKKVCKEENVCHMTDKENQNCELDPCTTIIFGVTGQGVAPANTISPAQAIALAKRAAIADAYRLLAEKIYGVKVEGDDYIRNMVVKRTTVRTHVAAMIQNARIVDTGMKDGLYEVEMELTLDGRQWYQLLVDY
jgi:hypothetical protein